MSPAKNPKSIAIDLEDGEEIAATGERDGVLVYVTTHGRKVKLRDGVATTVVGPGAGQVAVVASDVGMSDGEDVTPADPEQEGAHG